MLSVGDHCQAKAALCEKNVVMEGYHAALKGQRRRNVSQNERCFTLISGKLCKLNDLRHTASENERSTSDDSFGEELQTAPNTSNTSLVDEGLIDTDEEEEEEREHTETGTYITQTSEHAFPELSNEDKVLHELNMVLIEGDILLTKDEVSEMMHHDMEHGRNNRFKRQAHSNSTRLWPDATVYYTYAANATETTKRIFNKSIVAWSEDTCVEFKENAAARDYVVIYDWLGCLSHIGRIGGPQGLYLGQLCYTIGHMAHEIGHVLGLYHTHVRPDRDKYVRIYKTLKKHLESQFRRVDKRLVSTYNLSYDYGSIMHYSARSASIDNRPAIKPYPDTRYLQTLGSPMISFYDKLLVNMHYKCLDKCDKMMSRIKCQNGGFLHPRDCSKCVCPRGYGGRDCSIRPKDGCGKTFYAKTWFHTFNATAGRKDYNPNNPNDEFLMCTYWIRAPVGSRIEVRFDNYSRDGKSDGCKYSGVEIKTGNDTRLTGYRICDYKWAGMSFNSTSNIVPVIAYARFSPKTAVLSYRIIYSDPKTCRDSFMCKISLRWSPCTFTTQGSWKRENCPKSCGFCL